MAISRDDIRLVHRVVGTKHVYTSPDVPELHVSHADQNRAFNAVQSALDMVDRMKRRLAATQTMNEIAQQRRSA